MTPSKNVDLIREQISILLNLYQHHLELFWKWISLYVTITSGISLFIFNKDIPLSTKRLFPMLIAAASLGVSMGCIILWSWLKELEREVKQMTREIDAYSPPSF